jgi:poly(hydroxyalkanoate) depolymerase family esterase
MRRAVLGAASAMRAQMREQWMKPAALPPDIGGIGMVDISEFGSNPGQLRMRFYVPKVAPAPGVPLIVVLHGCGQTAHEFAQDGEWLTLADRLRLPLPLLLAEQTEQNNGQHCFNWFRPGDAARGRGEALSIQQMVAEAIRRFGSDPKRVFVVGLSAGGAMAAALLAAYPDVFAAGAVVAGAAFLAARYWG